jgi:hypothetical protein
MINDIVINVSQVVGHSADIVICIVCHSWLSIVSQTCASISDACVLRHYTRGQGNKAVEMDTLAGIILRIQALVNLVVVLKNTLEFRNRN